MNIPVDKLIDEKVHGLVYELLYERKRLEVLRVFFTLAILSVISN